MRLRLAAVAALACAGACNAISGLSEDYVLAEPEDGGPDAAPPVQIGPADADAAVDAGPPENVRDCADASDYTVFCMSFDGKDPLLRFDRKEATGGEPEVVADAGPNGSRALRARAVADGGTVTSLLWKTLPPTDFSVGTNVIVAFDARVSAVVEYAAVGVLQFAGREHGLAAYGVMCPAGQNPCFNDNDQEGRDHNQAGALFFDRNRWYHVVYNVHRTASGYASKITVDGNVVDERTTGTFPSSLVPVEGKVEVGFGSFFTSVKPGVNEAYIDNIVITMIEP